MSELLSPAGSSEALEAAIEGGADAVYFGAVGFNARKNARNFTEQEMREAIALAHTYGVRVYVTQNTLICDREQKDYLSAAESALAAGADALIVADIGGAAEIHRRFPKAHLHASTQMSGHCVAAAERLAKLGFSRMVCAREMSFADISHFTAASPIEAEVFVHGALCVCHSGQCLFSSVVGGRSGNRGECAQPCRLPYSGSYPLSLRDLALARHIPELIAAGVASFKIEGRMKSPEYVRDVTAVYRRLIDENRPATDEEMRELAAVFSRGGFTDGYFTGHIGHAMLGIRSDADKEASRTLLPFRGITKKRPVEMTAEFRADRESVLTLRCGNFTASATGMVPLKAETAPMTDESVSRSLSRLGNTPFSPGKLHLVLDEGLMLPVSALNALRRQATDKLLAAMQSLPPLVRCDTAEAPSPAPRISFRSAVFRSPDQIPPSAKDWFDHIYLPPQVYDGSCDGVVLPPVIFDSEREKMTGLLKHAAAQGARHALVGNLGHLDLALEAGLVPHGDFRLNVTNTASASLLTSLGFADVVLSPELTLPQARDIPGATALIVYGRLPLMILEKCVGKEIGSCKACTAGQNVLVDRRGIRFPVLREWEHRSVIFNSLPTCLSDRMDSVRTAGIAGEHYIFSTETRADCDAVIKAFRDGTPLGTEVRRLNR